MFGIGKRIEEAMKKARQWAEDNVESHPFAIPGMPKPHISDS